MNGRNGMYFFKYFLSFKTKKILNIPPIIIEESRVVKKKSKLNQKEIIIKTIPSPIPNFCFFNEIKKTKRIITKLNTNGYILNISKSIIKNTIQYMKEKKRIKSVMFFGIDL